MFISAFLRLENKDFSADIIPYEDDTGHDHLCDPLAPSRTEEIDPAKPLECRNNFREQPNAEQIN